MAPELFEYGAKRPTTAVDMFSYGVLMWCGPAAPGVSMGLGFRVRTCCAGHGHGRPCCQSCLICLIQRAMSYLRFR